MAAANTSPASSPTALLDPHSHSQRNYGTIHRPSASGSSHRTRRSVSLSTSELVEIRAAQRTFEGAYIRTAIGQFTFALVVLKIFTKEFYAVGAVFAGYGAFVLFLSQIRKHHSDKQFFRELGEDGIKRRKFRTSGNPTLFLTVVTAAMYMTLIVLIVRIDQST